MISKLFFRKKIGDGLGDGIGDGLGDGFYVDISVLVSSSLLTELDEEFR